MPPLSMWSIMPGGPPNRARWPTSFPGTLTSSRKRWPCLCSANINDQTYYGPFSSMPGSTYDRGIETFKDQEARRKQCGVSER
jgi:hypothetical protein